MSTSYIDIKSSLKTLIEDNVSNLAATTDYASGSFANYPACQITFLRGESESRQNVRRYFTYVYRVEVFVEQGTNFSASKTERIAGEIVDELLTILNDNITLGGGVQEVRPLAWSMGYESDEVNTRTITMDVEVRKLETISS
jgi:hypothetical protein